MTKTTIWVVLVLLLVIFVLNIVGILWLKQEVVNLRNKRIALLNNYDVLNTKNQALSGQIAVKNAELGELKKIEEMIGIDSESSTSYSERIDVAKHTFIERNFMLNYIPSGYPFAKRKSTRITSPYGYRKHPAYGGRAMHWGIDMQAKTNTSVHATAKGVVVFVGRNSGFGKLIKIWHGFGFETYFAHFKQICGKKRGLCQ